MKRTTIRARLTVLYAGAFFIAGAILIALLYLYLNQSLERRPIAELQGVARQVLGEPGLRNRPVADRVLAALAAQVEREREETLRAMLTWSLFALAVVGIVAGGFGWLLAGRALRPLQQITATARRVADRSLHERIALAGPHDEIKDLADTFDSMLERLDRAFDGQRRFVADASHELRTPLTINRTLIEVALQEPDLPENTRQLGVTLLEVNHRHERLIDGLLVLAASQQLADRRSGVDLAALAANALAVADSEARPAGIRLTAGLEYTAVNGDPVLLERLAQNLIDNGVRHNAATGGWVAVSVGADGTHARLSVVNSGPRIPAHAVDGLFEPFRRMAGDRVAGTGAGGGAGLGLAIVRSITAAHGGQIRAVARPEGGLTVTVLLPLDQ